jgi:hypothetical protein
MRISVSYMATPLRYYGVPDSRTHQSEGFDPDDCQWQRLVGDCILISFRHKRSKEIDTMPFTGPSSYLTTIDEFRAHWTNVNVALAPNPLILLGPYALADLDSDRDDLSDAITDLVAGTNVVEGHRQDRDVAKPEVRERMRQLGSKVRGLLAESTQEGHIPDLIDMNSNPGKWLIAMRDSINMWTDINANPPAGFVGPLTLFGGYTLANFTADCTALETTFESLTLAEQNEDDFLKARDAIYVAIRDHLVTYRDAVEGSFPANHPLVLSLPRISPLPGHTPDPVVLSGVWNDTTKEAELSWTASEDPDLAYYTVRRNGEDPYDGGEEIFVESLLPGILTLSTAEGLGEAGTMGFKVYVVLDTGNERGSNAVTIVNPG